MSIEQNSDIRVASIAKVRESEAKENHVFDESYDAEAEAEAENDQ